MVGALTNDQFDKIRPHLIAADKILDVVVCEHDKAVRDALTSAVSSLYATIETITGRYLSFGETEHLTHVALMCANRDNN